MKFFKNGTFLLFIFFALIIVVKAQSPTSGSSEAAKSLVLVENKVTKGPVRDRRHIFFLLPESEMSLDSIKSIFEANRREFCEPYELVISIFSDSAQLQKSINTETIGYAIEFREDEAGREAARKYYERVYPSPSGYLRAEYNRYGEYEFFDYGLIKDDPTMTRVHLEHSNAEVNICRKASSAIKKL